MRCALFTSASLSGIPLVECGGVLLNPGQTLVVKDEIAERMTVQYGPSLVLLGHSDRDKLKHGHYELSQETQSRSDDPDAVKKDDRAVKDAHDSLCPEMPEPSMSSSRDKSLQGKTHLLKQKG